jgi:outer membrane autotransporter protein
MPAPAPEKRWGMFATGQGLFFRGNAHDVDLQSADANIAGTTAGLDAKIGDHAMAGALFAYDNADVTLNNNGSHATIDSYTGGLYGAWHQDGFYVNSLAAYTSNHYRSNRDIFFPGFAAAANGGTHGNQASVNIDGGYDWHVSNRLTVGPLVGLQYVHLDVNGFNEYGASAADLAIADQSMDSLQSRVGGRADFHLASSSTSTFAAELHAAWQHEYLDDSRGIGATFAGSGLTPFSVQTVSPMRDAAVVGLGLNFTFKDRLTLFADYELTLWNESNFNQSVNAGGRISF